MFPARSWATDGETDDNAVRNANDGAGVYSYSTAPGYVRKALAAVEAQR